MPRAAKKSDANYNARRRFTRAATRYLKKAENTVGEESRRYRELARDATSKAAELYERKADISRSKRFTDLASKLGINVKEYMQSETPTARERQRSESLRRESYELAAMQRGTREERELLRRDQEASAIMNSRIGSRIYAGLVDIWSKPVYDPETGEYINKRSQADIDQLIIDYFGVESMMDVIELLEKEVDLYSNPESIEQYDTVSLTISQMLYR